MNSYLYINDHYTVEQLTESEKGFLSENGLLVSEGIPMNYVVRNLATSASEFYSSNLPTAMNAARSLNAGMQKEEIEYSEGTEHEVTAEEAGGTAH